MSKRSRRRQRQPVQAKALKHGRLAPVWTTLDRYSVALATICLLSLGAFLLLPLIPASGSVAFSLHDFENLALHYDTQQDSHSPMCGCYYKQEGVNWRGVAFAGRDVTVSHEGRFGDTAFVFAAAASESPSWQLTKDPFSAEVIDLVLPTEATFDPSRVLVGTDQHWQVLRRQRVPAIDSLVLGGISKLSIALTGERPLGSWMPVHHSDISLGYEFNIAGDQLRNSRLVEVFHQVPFDPELKVAVAGTPGDPVAFSTGDFLGQLVAWAEDAIPIVVYQGREPRPALPLQAGYRHVTAIAMTPPFAMRMAVMSVDPTLLREYSQEAEKGLDRKRFPWASRDKGRVELTVHTPTAVSEFQRVYDRIKQDEIIPVAFTTLDGRAVKKWYRMPPIPPNAGFNIFGAVTSLTIESAVGTLSVGADDSDQPTPKKWEFKNIAPPSNKDAAMAVGVIDSNARSAVLNLQATSQVAVNGESLTNAWHRIRRYNDPLILWAQIVAAVSGVLALVRISSSAIRKRRTR